MMRSGLLAAVAALALTQIQPAAAWMRGGTTAGGDRWGAAAGGGPWAAGANGRSASGSYGTSSNGTHYATSSRGGSAEAGNGSWSSQSASGKTNSASYGTTAYGTHYATGAYGGAAATNNGHWAAENNGQYAYGNRYAGNVPYAGACHPPAVVNQYYGTGCYNCGGWGAAAGVVAGTAVVAAASAPPANAGSAYASAGYAPNDVYVALPSGCASVPNGNMALYDCHGVWFSPAFGANGVYYRVIPPP